MRLTVAAFLILIAFSLAHTDEVPYPQPSHEGLNVKKIGTMKDLTLGLWVQHRVMYNNSSIPGVGDTSFSDTEWSDFIRQRLRVGLDVRSSDNVGAYVQLEYRGGWGGSSPTSSDPRELPPVINPYNRLQSRGVRYGFLYANMSEAFNLSAGIIPLTDMVGRVMFDADRDFNVGGVLLWGKADAGEYRFAYVRLVEGIEAVTTDNPDHDEDLIVVDFKPAIVSSIDLGVHFYSLMIPEGSTSPLGAMIDNQTWFGVTGRKSLKQLDIDGMFLFNRGEFGDESHSGFAIGAGAGIPIGQGKIDVRFIKTTGDTEGETDNRFVTLHQLVDPGTGLYSGKYKVRPSDGRGGFPGERIQERQH
jgi:hypothetical protein